MHQRTAQEQAILPYLLEQGKAQQNRDVHLMAITGRGTGQIIDINNKGLSFGCLYTHFFPDEWNMDVLDADGTFIKKMRVRKIWEHYKERHDLYMKFELIVGVEFVELNTLQTRKLNYLLGNLEQVYYQQ